MKKVLSVLLAILMTFSFMTVALATEGNEGDNSGSGETTTTDNTTVDTETTKPTVLKFHLDGGKLKAGINAYDPTTGQSSYVDASDVEDTFMISGNYQVGTLVSLPSVEPPKGYSFVAWQVVSTTTAVDEDGKPLDEKGKTYSTVLGGYEVKYVGEVIEFRALYEAGAVETDTFQVVFDVLIKIFGTIYALFTGQSPEAGQAVIANLFKSISG